MVFSIYQHVFPDKFSWSENLLYILIFFFIVIFLISLVYDIKRNNFSGSKILKWFSRNFNLSERLGRKLGFTENQWENLTVLEKRIIHDTYVKAKHYGVKLNFVNEKSIKYPTYHEVFVSGYFNDGNGKTKPELGLAIGKYKEDWLLVLLHESSHMDQWIDQNEHWLIGNYRGKDVYDLVDDWVNGEEMSSQEIEWILGCCISIELDCEKRALEKLKYYKLNWISQSEYIQRANSYIAYYGVLRVNRKWYNVAPYENMSVWSKMPRIFLNKDKYLNLDSQYINIYNENCY